MRFGLADYLSETAIRIPHPDSPYKARLLPSMVLGAPLYSTWGSHRCDVNVLKDFLRIALRLSLPVKYMSNLLIQQLSKKEVYALLSSPSNV